MEKGKVMSFRNILALKSTIEKDLEELKHRSEEYSEIIGEKLRSNVASNEPDLADLKDRIAEPVDPKKKKPIKKKDQKGNWHALDGVFIYNGIGLRGELEIYFKALEDAKARIEKLQKIRESIDGLVSRGVKNDLGCTASLSKDFLLDIAFTKSASVPTKFTFKSTFRVDAERLNEIKV